MRLTVGERCSTWGARPAELRLAVPRKAPFVLPTPQEAAAIRPRIIHVVTIGPGDTVQSLASQMAYRDFKLDRFLSLNGLAPNSRLLPGQRVKLVIYGARRP